MTCVQCGIPGFRATPSGRCPSCERATLESERRRLGSWAAWMREDREAANAHSAELYAALEAASMKIGRLTGCIQIWAERLEGGDDPRAVAARIREVLEEVKP